MKEYSWFSQISFRQRVWLFATIVGMLAIVGVGFLVDFSAESEQVGSFNTDMSIKDIAPKLGVTGKNLAREFGLPLNTPKKKPLKSLGVTDEELQHAVHHIASHSGANLKYYVYLALSLGGLIFLVRLGRPDNADIESRHCWYPRTPFIVCLLISVVAAGFLLGKSPNPMEGIVKVFKTMVGLYPDPVVKVAAFVFFIILVIVGNKIICGWACPFGALQELIYSIPILKKLKKRKLPFVLTNTIRAGLFIAMLLFLFGIVGGRKGFVLYHDLNPFNLFDLDIESLGILLTVIIALLASFVVYRPFCQLICPFGFISWIAERFSIFRVRVDREKCNQCGACIVACPVEAAKDIVDGKKLPADCFSCARCLNVCPTDAIKYISVFESGK